MGKNIIIRTPNFIGDTIMMLPALSLVRTEYPEACITVVCRELCQDIFRGQEIEEIIVDNTKKGNRLLRTIVLIRLLRKKSYDLGILFQNSFLSAFVFRLARIKTIIGYEKESRKVLLDFHIRLDRHRHYVNHYANLVNEYFDGKYKLLPEMKLFFQASNLLKKGTKPLVGFIFGGTNKNTERGVRQYPEYQVYELLQLLDDKQIDIVFLGDNEDAPIHQLYENQLKEEGKECINLTGKTTVAEYIDAIATLDLLVTIDTSAMHIAAAVGTEFIVIVGKGTSSFDTVKPKGDKGHILFSGERYIRDEDIIKAIKSKDIYAKMLEILNKKSIFEKKEL